MTSAKKTLLLLSLAMWSTTSTLFAQTNGSNSPYSRYGFGLLSERSTGFNKGMGGVAYGMRNGHELNPSNPASYSAIDSLSFLFDIGMTFQNGHFDDGSSTTNARNTSLDYVTAGFRVSRNLGMSVGLLPYSTIGYSMETTDPMSEGSTSTKTSYYDGDGGLRELYLGLGWQVFPHFSVGANAGMLWGEMDHTVLSQVSTTDANSLRRQYTSDITTYKVNVGMQIDFKVAKEHEVVIGATYGLGHKIHSSAHFYNQLSDGSSIIEGDSITARNAFELPHTFGAGLSWTYKERLRVGADYEFQKWSDNRYPTVTESQYGEIGYEPLTGSFDNTHRVTVGADYTPNPYGLRWRHFVTYRAGFSYRSAYTLVDGEKGPRYYSVSAGVGLPIINRYNNRSTLNLSVQYEWAKPRVAGQIEEQYLRICLGMSFNERWFMKWKIE